MNALMILGDVVDAAEATAGMRLCLPARVEGRFGNLVVSVEHFEAAALPERSRRVRPLSPADVDRVRAAMRDQLATSVRRSSVAALIGMSVSQFSRACHASLGMTFSDDLTQLRIEGAKDLLRTTRLSLCEVALTSGFGDQSHFSRTFARCVGVTPFRWRLVNGRRRDGP